MKSYVIKDWSGNVMKDGYSSFDDAVAAIDEIVRKQLLEEGIDTSKTYGLENDYPAFEEILDKIVSEYAGEYHVEEIL